MCDHCTYIGEGDFICDKGPGEPVVVVDDWDDWDDWDDRAVRLP